MLSVLNRFTEPRANLIGIGAPRTATSSLAKMLGVTRDVFVPEKKELNGFGILDKFAASRYNLHFATAGEEKRYLADISPVYLSNPQVAERIRSYNPEARIIATLRDPVSRVVSQYRHMKATVDRSVGPELGLDLNAYLENGLIEIGRHEPSPNSWYSAAMNIGHSFYGRHLRRYYQCFSRDQILVLIYEDFVRPGSSGETGTWERQLQQFLGVTVTQTYWDNRSEASETEIAGDLANALKELFADEVAMASELIGRDLGELWGYPS